MSPVERAEKYAGVFIAAGRKWRMFVPVDATVSGDTVHLGGVQMRPVGGAWGRVWELTENGRSWIVQPVEPEAVKS